MPVTEITFNLDNSSANELNIFSMTTEKVVKFTDIVKNIKYGYELYRKDTDTGEIRYYVRVDNIYGKYFFEQNIDKVNTTSSTLNISSFTTSIIDSVVKYTLDGYLIPSNKITLFSKTWVIDQNGNIVEGDRDLTMQNNMTQGGSLGDPYVYPMCSNVPVKLPNKRAYYRMFEQDNCYVNAYVDKASLEHTNRMKEYASKYTDNLSDVIVDGYFYKKFFISAEGHELVVDLVKHKMYMNKDGQDFFTIKRRIGIKDNTQLSSNNIVYDITWKKINNDEITTSVMFYNNPHIENGISVIPKNTRNAIGMLVKNYIPSFMEIQKLREGKNKRLHENLILEKKPYEEKNIMSKSEIWIY